MADRVERRLAGILAADVAGYSRLVGEDEGGTLTAPRTMRREAIDPKIAEHRGRIVKTTGDGLLVEFASIVDALRCAAEWQAAIERLETAQRFSPRGRVGFVGANIGVAYFLMRRFEEAVPKILLQIQSEPEFTAAYRWLASCYAHMGRLDDARAELARLRDINPRAIHPQNPAQHRNPEQRELFVSGLRLAMGEG